MSYYYTYYIGMEKDGKIYPIGLYDHKGKIHYALTVSQNFASDLYKMFTPVTEEMFSDELTKEFCCYNGLQELQYLPIDSLPDDTFIKHGYCLREDILSYINTDEDDYRWDLLEDLKYNMISEEVFAFKAVDEMQNGVPKPTVDCEGEIIPVHSCKDYAFFCAPDYHSKEYEAFLLKVIADLYWYTAYKEAANIVILMMQG